MQILAIITILPWVLRRAGSGGKLVLHLHQCADPLVSASCIQQNLVRDESVMAASRERYRTVCMRESSARDSNVGTDLCHRILYTSPSLRIKSF